MNMNIGEPTQQTPTAVPDCTPMTLQVAHSHQERSDLDYAVQIASAIFRNGRSLEPSYVAAVAVECMNEIKKGLKE